MKGWVPCKSVILFCMCVLGGYIVHSGLICRVPNLSYEPSLVSAMHLSSR